MKTFVSITFKEDRVITDIRRDFAAAKLGSDSVRILVFGADSVVKVYRAFPYGTQPLVQDGSYLLDEKTLYIALRQREFTFTLGKSDDFGVLHAQEEVSSGPNPIQLFFHEKSASDATALFDGAPLNRLWTAKFGGSRRVRLLRFAQNGDMQITGAFPKLSGETLTVPSRYSLTETGEISFQFSEASYLFSPSDKQMDDRFVNGDGDVLYCPGAAFGTTA